MKKIVIGTLVAALLAVASFALYKNMDTIQEKYL